MGADLVFGWRTALLGLAAAQVLVLSASLAVQTRNRAANRRLAALLVILVGILTPYVIGYAGFYDAWPWLSFAPFSLPLAVGPLALAYVRAWTDASMRPPLAAHLAPAGLHFAYGLICFSLPLPMKMVWADQVDGAWVAPAVAALTPVSLAVYVALAVADLRSYRTRLGQAVSDEARYAQAWLARALTALAVTLAVWSGFQAWELAIGPLDYFARLPLYLTVAALALYLAVEGWRRADLRRPDLPRPDLPPGGRDWRHDGARWAQRVEAEGWWREPDLTLADLAARLGTNTHYLSRALNEGLGRNFAGFINGRRARAVADAIAAGDRRPILELALEAGFNSKASFNRAYRAETGETPSQSRARVSEPKVLPAARS